MLFCVGTVAKIEYQWSDKVCEEIITLRVSYHFGYLRRGFLVSKEIVIELNFLRFPGD